jgi:hypothetical protein
MKKSLWNDNFMIEFSVPLSYNEFERKTEFFEGSLKSAIKFALNRYPGGAANFYTSEGTWLKKIMW